MLESLYKCNKTIKTAEECWLHDPASQYLNYLLSTGYAKSTLRSTAYWLIRIALFSQQRGVKNLAALPEMVGLLVDCYDVKTSRQSTRCVLQGFIRYMRSEGMIPPPPKPVLPLFNATSFKCFMSMRRYFRVVFGCLCPR